MEKKTKAATESGVLLLVIAGILVAINAISALGFYKRADWTRNEKYTLSKGSGNLLKSMKQKLKVDAYVTKGLPQLDAFVRDLRDLLVEYKQAEPNNFEFQIIETKDEESRKKAKDAGLQEVRFGEEGENEGNLALSVGYMGLVLQYGEKTDVIKYLQPERTDGLEFWITNKIRELRDEGDNVKHQIGILSGVDEIKLTDTNLVPSGAGGKPSMQQIISQNFKFYQFQDVDLKGGESAIDDKLDGLLISQPGRELTEKELRRIDEFLMKGKSLAVFASAVNTKANDASMQGALKTQGLEKLLEGYGIELRKDVLFDHGNAFQVLVPNQLGGVSPRPFPQFLHVTEDSRFSGDEQLLDTSFPTFFRLTEVVVPFASSLVLHQDKQPGAKYKVVARTTPRTTRKTDETVELSPFKPTPPKGEAGQQIISVSVDSEKLKSAFPSGDKQGIDAPAESVKPARVFVLASSEFLTNPLARAGNGPDMGQMGMMMPSMGGDEKLLRLATPYAQQALTPSILALKNTLDWLSGETDLLATSAKIAGDPKLQYGDVSKLNFDPNESEEQAIKREKDLKDARKDRQKAIQWGLILGVPLLLVLYGVLRWRMKISSRANVSLT